MLKFIKDLFKSRKPTNCQLLVRIFPIWDYKYVELRYSTNNGISWNAIQTLNAPLYPGENYQLNSIKYKFRASGNFDREIDQFKTINDIEAYEAQQIKLRDEGNIKLGEGRKAELEYKKKLIERANRIR